MSESQNDVPPAGVAADLTVEINSLLNLLKLASRFAPARAQAIVTALESILGTDWVQKALGELWSRFGGGDAVMQAGPGECPDTCPCKDEVEAIIAKYAPH